MNADLNNTRYEKKQEKVFMACHMTYGDFTTTRRVT